jgi:hypothetical protein
MPRGLDPTRSDVIMRDCPGMVRGCCSRVGGSMWLWVLVLGLSGVAAAVLVWYVRWRRAKRAAETLRWHQHQEWLRESERGQR